MKKRVAIIGSRRISQKEFDYLKQIASAIVRRDMQVSTGSAEGADYAAMLGAREVDPNQLYVYLPWSSYNSKYHGGGGNFVTYNEREHLHWKESVLKHHPAPDRLSRGAMSLHARNYGIVEQADIVIAMPMSNTDLGGTGQGIRLARTLGKELYLVCNKEDRVRLRDKLRVMPRFA